MKKTVRIRKAKKGETPGYINKTQKFLEKAQVGMSVGSNGEQQQLMQQIYTSAYNSLMNDTPADVVYYNIINDYGVDGNTAGMIMQYAFHQLVQEGYINPETMQDQTGEEQSDQPTEQGPTEEEMLGQEEEELTMSEMDEDNSHIYNYANEDSFDEQAMQQEAFEYGGETLTKMPTLNPSLLNALNYEAQLQTNFGEMPKIKRETFDEAFSRARGAGEKEFTWNNKRYNTETAEDVAKEIASELNDEQLKDAIISLGKQVEYNSYGNDEDIDEGYNRSANANERYDWGNYYKQPNYGRGTVTAKADILLLQALQKILGERTGKIPRTQYFNLNPPPGVYQYGGTSEDTTSEDPVLDQYNTPGQADDSNFSLEEMIQNQAGVQLFDPQGTGISNYLPDYRSISSWNNENWLAKKGGSVPELPKASGGKQVGKELAKTIKKGYDWYNKIPQLQNVSALGKIAPVFTGLGYGLHKTPGLNWMLGMKKGPQADSYLTQNIIGLQNLAKGDPAGDELFSKNLSNPEEFNVDRLVFATEDLQNIITKGNTEGRSSFSLSDAVGGGEGSIGGIYSGDSKISMGQDDEGNKFFDISTSYKPGDPTGFFTIPSDSKTVKFRNRFYYTPNEAGTFDVFDGAGEPLVTGTNNMFKVTRPLVPSLYRIFGDTLFRQSGNVLGSSGMFGLRTGPGIRTSSFPRSLVSRQEITSLPPKAFKELGASGQIGRGLEQLGYQYGTFPFGAIASGFGYNPLRTRGKNIIDISEPTLSYGNTSKNITAPLDDVNVAEDILNNTNPFRRYGRNAALGLGLTGYLGYNIYDALYGEQDPLPLGPVRTMLPQDVQTHSLTDYELSIPDSLEGIRSNDFYNTKNYWDRRYNTLDPLDWDTVPENQKEGGKVSKKKFTKKLLSFYEEGGANEIGRGDRMDTATKAIDNLKKDFIKNLKDNSNKAITGEIYDLAKTNPEVMNTLMQNGYKENLAEDQGPPQPMEEAQWGMNMGNEIDTLTTENMDDYINFLNQMNIQSGGFVDMNAENPLTRFVSGGIESESYEPYDIPKAHEGMHQNCPPGYVYNSTYGQCVPMMQYRPNYVPRTTSGGLFRTLAPWNPLFSGRTPWTRQTSLPYFVNTGNPYMGQLGPMVMKDVYDSRGLFKRRPNKWIEYYDPTGKGITPEMLEQLMQNNQDGRGPKKKRDKRNRRVEDSDVVDNDGIYDAAESWFFGDSDIGLKVRGRSDRRRRKPRTISQIHNDALRDEIRIEKLLKRNKKRAERENELYGEDGKMEQKWWKQHGKEWAKRQKEEERGGRGGKGMGTSWTTRRLKKKLNRLQDYEQGGQVNYINPIAYGIGGYLPQASRGGLTGGFFDANTGFGVGIGDKSSAYNQFSPQTQFENDLFGGDTWGAPQKLNPFSFITPTGTGSYAETRDTGVTLDQQGQNVIPQKQDPVDPCADATEEELMDPTSECYNGGLVAIHKQNENMKTKDPEPWLNLTNAIGRGVAGFIDKARNKKPQEKYIMDQLATEMNAPTTGEYSFRGNVGAGIGQGVGMLRYPDKGQDASGMSANVTQFGGPIMNEGGTHKMYNGLSMRNSDHKHYEQDEVTFMTQEELDNYLAAGGQVEYLY